MRKIILIFLSAILLSLTGIGRGAAVKVFFEPARPVKGDFVVVRLTSCDPGLEYSIVLRTPDRIVFPVPEMDGGRATGFAVFPFKSADTASFEILENTNSVLTGAIDLEPSAVQTGRTQKISVNTKYVEPPAKEYARIERDVKTMKVVHSFYTNARFFGDNPVFPVLDGRLGSLFGEQRVLNGVRGSVHYGVDIRSNRNKVIMSLYAGKVIYTGNLYYSGNTVVVSHGYGLMSQYLHLAEISVKEGDFVKAGQKLGRMGMTGRATGPHLHLSCYLMGIPFNPLSLFARIRK